MEMNEKEWNKKEIEWKRERKNERDKKEWGKRDFYTLFYTIKNKIKRVETKKNKRIKRYSALIKKKTWLNFKKLKKKKPKC